jgi:Ca-activated chloride channel family protein
MTFIWPGMLVGLLLIPVFVVSYMWMQQRRRGMAARYGNPALVQEVGTSGLRVRRHIPPFIFLCALATLIVALARPQTLVSLPHLEGTVILAFDVSASMSGDDLKPTRLEAAKAAARAFVERQPPSVQVGVVSFSDTGFSTQSPTNDQAAVLAAIGRLTTQRGTSLARGIESSINAIAAMTNQPLTLSIRPSNETPTPTPAPVPMGSYTSAVIVLLTDGENTQSPDPLGLAQTAADRGIRIYTVGVGSAEGATLNLDGFTVRSKLDEQTLQQISQMTGGTYYSAGSEEELQSIYDHLTPQIIMKEQKTEVTSLLAGAGIFVLMLGGALSLWWLGRMP